MVSSESPAVARRRLRLALRNAREAMGLTQGKVAEALEWSLSKVNRIESGEVTVSNTDVKALLALFDVTDVQQVESLLGDARTSRQRGWWDEAPYREHLTPATRQLLQFESEATAMRVFHPTLIPGMLQTPAYAEHILNFWNEHLPEQDRSARLEVRLRRRNQVLGREDPPHYYLVLDESVTWREVGGAAVMAEQLHSLLESARHPSVSLRVLPMADGAPMSMLGPFTVLGLGDDENAILYREMYLADEVVQDPEVIGGHRRHFEQMWQESLDESASIRLVEARAASMLASLDRRR
jgi:transcriptional regulator with XRE-family HTH domain